MDRARATVVQEARELLETMDRTLAYVCAEGDDTDSVNKLFRAVHTIKGSAGLLAFERIVGFTHLLESVLDCVRGNNLELAPPLLSLLVDCGDYIAELVDAIEARREDVEPDADKRARLERALMDVLAEHGELPEGGPVPPGMPRGAASLSSASGGGAAFPDAIAGLSRPWHEGAATLAAAPPAGSQRWRIELGFDHDVLRSGMDPLEFLRSLEAIGTILEVRTHADALPPAADMDPESCYLGFSLLLASDCGREAIEGVFEFVRDDSSIVVEPLPAESPHDPASAGVQVDAWSAGVPAAEAGPGEAPAGPAEAPRNGKEAPAQAYVKIPVDRLDALIDLVGELVISGASANQVADRENNPAFKEAAQSMRALVEQIRDAALTLRMIPIGEVFQRFPRVVRGVARQLGKEIRLTMTGTDTELDKSMIEKLPEPLMHIVRNALDHGLEPASERLAAGKPAVGTLHLAAHHDSGAIVIEVSDDGRGLDLDRIRRKAVERGLLAADEPLSEDDAYRLLFEPGFSTTDRVTRLSGRGVGMDVVRKSVESLRGETEVVSRPGQGTLVRIRLPLTLAIIDGFLVEVGDSTFVIPMDMVAECVDLRDHEIQDGVLALHGEPLPCARLRDVFGLPPAAHGHGRHGRAGGRRGEPPPYARLMDVLGLPPAEGARESLVVVQYGRRQRAGLVVDRLLGEFQTVIKPLGVLFDKVGPLNGSTILGDGRVALILDVPQLIQRAVTANAVHAGAGGNE